MKSFKIATIAGDGIGKEVVPESLKVLKEAAKKHQFKIDFVLSVYFFSIYIRTRSIGLWI